MQKGIKVFHPFLSPVTWESICYERHSRMNAVQAVPCCLPEFPFHLERDSLIGFSKTLKVVSASAMLFETELSSFFFLFLLSCYFVYLLIFLSITFMVQFLGTSSIPMDNPVTASPVRNKHPVLWELELYIIPSRVHSLHYCFFLAGSPKVVFPGGLYL